MFACTLRFPAGRIQWLSPRRMDSSVANRAPSRYRCALSLCAGVIAMAASAAIAAENSYPLEVFPPEHLRMTDARTGAELLFLTTAPESDLNLYFHEYSWLADESVILFTSSRAKGGLMGYLTATGELIWFNTPEGPLGGATAAARGNAVLAVRGRSIVEIKLAIVPSSAPEVRPSRVSATERVLCTLADGSPGTALNPSCDGKYVSLGVTGYADPKRGPTICKIAIKSGKLTEVCRLPQTPAYGGHVQWSRTNPHLISFAGGRGPTKDFAGPVPSATAPEDYAGRGQRLWVVDIREGVPRNVYVAEEGELVTHESWWVNDQLLFCGGKGPTPPELSHVKALNIYSGQVRIVGPGPGGPKPRRRGRETQLVARSGSADDAGSRPTTGTATSCWARARRRVRVCSPQAIALTARATTHMSASGHPRGEGGVCLGPAGKPERLCRPLLPNRGRTRFRPTTTRRLSRRRAGHPPASFQTSSR